MNFLYISSSTLCSTGIVLSERDGKGIELEWREGGGGERKEGRKIKIIIMTVTAFTLIPRKAQEF